MPKRYAAGTAVPSDQSRRECTAEVGDFALVQWWDERGEEWWIPCEVAAVNEDGIAVGFMRGNRQIRKDFGTRYISRKSIFDPGVVLPKLKSRYRYLRKAREAVIAAMADLGIPVPQVAAK